MYSGSADWHRRRVKCTSSTAQRGSKLFLSLLYSPFEAACILWSCHSGMWDHLRTVATSNGQAAAGSSVQLLHLQAAVSLDSAGF